jgi:hypothetical protein
MRGYSKFHEIKAEINQKRLKSCFSFFHKMRTQLQNKNAIMIQRWYRRRLAQPPDFKLKLVKKMSSVKKKKLIDMMRNKKAR